jgi:uncharacterized protein YjbK
MSPEEIEIKLDLANQENYLKLIDYLGQCKNELFQENIFIDTFDNDFRNAEKAVRIRKENDTVTVTIKGKSDRPMEGLVIRPEINVKTDNSIYKAVKGNTLLVSDLPPEILSQLDNIESVKPLDIIVSFKNTRRQFTVDTENSALLLEIDATEYPDGTIDYELEVELDDKSEIEPAIKHVSGLLLGLSIPVKPQNESKLIRALMRRSGTGSE